MGSYGIDFNNFVTLYHTGKHNFLIIFSYCKEIFISFVGTDAGKFDYVDVFTQNHSYKCAFSKLLDYNDHEVGHDCHQTG